MEVILKVKAKNQASILTKIVGFAMKVDGLTKCLTVLANKKTTKDNMKENMYMDKNTEKESFLGTMVLISKELFKKVYFQVKEC
jgi:23S rRNA maturation mini-RNase III